MSLSNNMKFLTSLFLCFLSLACFGADGYLARTNGNIVIGPGGSGGSSSTNFIANTNGTGYGTVTLDATATTNLSVNGTGANFVNALNVSSNLVVSNLTASRLVFSDAGTKLTSAAASGAVPVDADGSASLFSQINALASGSIITNGNAANMAFAGSMTNSGMTVTGSTAGLIVLGGTTGGLIVLSNSTAIATTQFGSNDYWFMTNTTTTKTIVATNGTMTAFAFVGDGSGLTGLPSASESHTNTWTTNTAFAVSPSQSPTNFLCLSGANTACGVTGILNAGTATERFGQLLIVASGNITFTNPAAFRASDFATTRVITNANNCFIAFDVWPGVSTNMIIVQTK